MSTPPARVTITRIFAAPPSTVFSAWTDPVQFGYWFGTAQTPVTDIALDVRPGGAWRARMIVGDSEIAWTGSYLEVEEPTRLVLTLSDGSGPGFEVVTVTFTEVPDGTEMVFTQGGDHLDADGYVRVEQGWQGFFADLDAALSSR